MINCIINYMINYIGTDDDMFLLEFDKELRPLRIVENIEKTGREDWQQMKFNLEDGSDMRALYNLLNDWGWELYKYREYFEENKINNIKILYGDLE